MRTLYPILLVVTQQNVSARLNALLLRGYCLNIFLKLGFLYPGDVHILFEILSPLIARKQSLSDLPIAQVSM